VDGLLRKQMRKYADGTLELTPVYQEPYPSPECFQPWETCMTMGQTWAHNPAETKWKAPRTLVRNLVSVVSRGGNYLLNVGPSAQGSFPPEAIERLKYIGRWMKTYNQAIYGTTYTPLQAQAWGAATRKGKKLYLHLFEWPVEGKLIVDSFPGQALSVSLHGGVALAFSQNGTQLEIRLPEASPDPDVSVLDVEIDPAENGWNAYSAPLPTTIPLKKYIQDQAIASAEINSFLNGLIAFFSYRTRANIPYAEAAVDILITVFIITFLTAWIMVGSARGQYAKGNIQRHVSPRRRLRLPKSGILRALLISAACVILFGGLFLNGLISLVSPVEINHWAYILIKTLYTGASGALASALAVLSVANDENRS
jgi:hypothetical protein